MPFADVNGQHLYFEDSGGDGPAVLFSHGFLMDHSMFEPQVDALSPEFRCITWDERGFGDSETDADFSYWDSAADAIALLDHLGLDQAVLAGMSQGGFLSLRAALANPERVRGLVLIDTQAGVEEADTDEVYRGMLADWMANGPANVGAAVSSIILGDEELDKVWMAKWEKYRPDRIGAPGRCLMDRDDITERLGEITCPALVVHGTADAAIPMAKAEELCERIPDCRGLVKVDGGSHAANLTHPEQVNGPLLEFLRSL